MLSENTKEKKSAITNLLALIIIFVLGKLLILIGGYFASITLGASLGQLLEEFPTNIDGGHYIFLAKNGYGSELISRDNIPGEYLYAFYPLYPLLIRVLTVVTGSYEMSALLISNMLCFFACYLMMKLVSKKEEKYLATIFFIGPISVFLTAAYTESLYVFLSVATYYLYKKRGMALSTQLLLGLTMLVRNTGYFLALALVIQEIYYNKRIFTTIKKFVIPGLTAVSYFIYCFASAGDLFLPFKCQKYWGNKVGVPFIGYFKDIFEFLNGGNMSIIMILAIMPLIIIVSCSIVAYKNKEDKLMITYMLITLVVLSSYYKDVETMSATTSLFRYLYGLFPIYTISAKYYSKKSKGVMIVIGISMTVMLSYAFFMSNTGMFAA